MRDRDNESDEDPDKDPSHPGVRNSISGFVAGDIVQAGSYTASYSAPALAPTSDDHTALRTLLRKCVVDLGETLGVVIGPGQALVLGGSARTETVALDSVAPDLAVLAPDLVIGDHLEAYEYLPDSSAPRLVVLEWDGRFDDQARQVLRHQGRPQRLTGSPVLNLRTGSVCGLVDARHGLALAAPDPAAIAGQPINQKWLTLLTREQLTAGGHRYPDQRLRDYLTAVRDSADSHPYAQFLERLGHPPPLSQLYVRQQADQDGHRIPATDVVARHPRGVQVIGEPGMGKSSLLRHIATTEAARWLTSGTGAFVPVQVPAEVLSRELPLVEALAVGVSDGVFQAKFSHAGLAELFASEPIAGVPWLVLVDALDEAPDHARAKVLESITRLRDNLCFEVVVTSRPLGIDLGARLARGSGDRAPTYMIERFTRAQRDRFAEKWFTALGNATPAETASRFLRRADEPQLRELTHIPLMATMLFILFNSDDTAQLPVNQHELFVQFIQLATDKLGKPTERRSETNPVRSKLMLALMEIAHRRHCARELDRRPLLDQVLDSPKMCWGDLRSVPERRDAAVAALRASGLVTQTSRGFDFLHPTIGEFLAARHLVVRYSRGPEVHQPRSLALLAPRRTWPWPHYKVKVFLAAGWLDSNVDLTRQLRRLLAWPHRSRNIEFIAELAYHGIPAARLPVDVRDRATRYFVDSVKSTTGEAWQRAVHLLWTYDPAVAARAVTSRIRALAAMGPGRDWTRSWRCSTATTRMVRPSSPGWPITSRASQRHGSPRRSACWT
ncbi:NACHT domain-containing protein [Actinokineospora globicatena]|uniref:NACHT domain-containing protein n=1 Tax=Actinokineospora globicatena TaxID=103729 RepID=UPI0020A3319D|nr:NACHT domain-containing protein [Actinokineospora globicatena]MCP2306797.1 NACHT domain-containing protein [Actinokineospora globicatena]GLW82078.1 hypothetical protein Aglo01_65590 [Actinokineospora globicatena]GLW88872.1 hypothetical protein Aglo02_65110 [Actinokineospora globicatena]